MFPPLYQRNISFSETVDGTNPQQILLYILCNILDSTNAFFICLRRYSSREFTLSSDFSLFHKDNIFLHYQKTYLHDFFKMEAPLNLLK